MTETTKEAVPWFRNQWKKGDLTPFKKGDHMAGGRQFPLMKGVIRQPFDREEVGIYMYAER